MKILVEKSLLERSGIIEEIKQYLISGKIPTGVCVNLHDGTVVFEPDNDEFCNLFGEITEDYEEIYIAGINATTPN